MTVLRGDLAALSTIMGTIFVAELTDKDAFLLIGLATKLRPLAVFAAGSLAFVITTALIVLLGSLLLSLVPILWIKVAGGLVMLAYGLWGLRGLIGAGAIAEEEGRLGRESGRSGLRHFLGMIAALVALDLAGDATEVLTIFFVAHFQDALLVFVGAVTALVAATALETMLGNRLSRVLSARRLRYVSVVIFLSLGAVVLLTAIWG